MINIMIIDKELNNDKQSIIMNNQHNNRFLFVLMKIEN